MRDIDDLAENYAELLHKKIGMNVKKIRQEKGLSQMELAQSIGYKSVSPISSGEVYYNKIHFNIEHLYKISYVLEVDINEFFKDID